MAVSWLVAMYPESCVVSQTVSVAEVEQTDFLLLDCDLVLDLSATLDHMRHCHELELYSCKKRLQASYSLRLELMSGNRSFYSWTL